MHAHVATEHKVMVMRDIVLETVIIASPSLRSSRDAPFAVATARGDLVTDIHVWPSVSFTNAGPTPLPVSQRRE